MGSEYKGLTEAGMLGGYYPENAELCSSAEGGVDTVLRDDKDSKVGDRLVRERRMLIGRKLFRVSSIFPAKATATPTDKMLSLIDSDLSKEAHSG